MTRSGLLLHANGVRAHPLWMAPLTDAVGPPARPPAPRPAPEPPQ